ncbi:MAG: protein-glutamate O-methyltransferase CheR [Bacteroidetes bacterium]|nr:MAG: protein-glutamate O-methyltransferase CheR [Bacteroidota bacterium]REK00745.1 MAG: protein-glutamate O-methyltransferase CheR [Bacteroidota bacterium]REK34993.1 MAG: protein-glutamate O-methyltransferase CheR [Bacteroidota bacterium]REK48209.1 MAG: protein-glutamate O-methyltransferase CheR [Bacteroidota bacterium]
MTNSIIFPIHEEQIQEFTQIICTYSGIDLSGYSRSFLVRKLQREIHDSGCSSCGAYLAILRNDHERSFGAMQSFTINYTEFFRDPEFFLALRNKVMPFLATYPSIKIWVAGCSTGEEAYSLAILLNEVNLLSRCSILATDINPENLSKAESGIFDASMVRNATSKFYLGGGRTAFHDYVTFGYDKIIFRDGIRERISFVKHDLTCGKIPGQFHLILCRNVLIYFGRNLQNDVIGMFYEGIRNLGYLGLGLQENLLFNKHANRYSIIDRDAKIYRKVDH